MLVIAWEDGSQSRLEGARLRWACPCAECRGEMGAPGRLDRGEPLAETELQLENVSLVGQYAFQIGFKSGHATGIYTFRRLRDLAASG